MDFQQRPTTHTWNSFLLIIAGGVAFITAYFLLPLYVTTLNCFDYCAPPISHTAWESSLQILAHLSNTPVIDAFVLMMHYVPLLATMMLCGCGFGFLIHPQRFLVKWFYRSWLAGIIALIIAVPFLFFFIRPDIGYFGMVLSYGLLWGGYRLFLAAHPELQAAVR